jgi:hypothetical protein
MKKDKIMRPAKEKLGQPIQLVDFIYKFFFFFFFFYIYI